MEWLVNQWCVVHYRNCSTFVQKNSAVEKGEVFWTAVQHRLSGKSPTKVRAVFDPTLSAHRGLQSGLYRPKQMSARLIVSASHHNAPLKRHLSRSTDVRFSLSLSLSLSLEFLSPCPRCPSRNFGGHFQKTLLARVITEANNCSPLLLKSY